MSWCVADDIQTPLDVAGQPKALFAVIAPIIDFEGSVWVVESFCGMGEVEATPLKARFALDLM